MDRVRQLPEMLHQGFKLGEVEVKPAEYLIISANAATRIEPKAMDVLVALAASGQDVVSREQLIAKVWPRGFVSDGALSRCVSNLRTALGDSPQAPRYIITLPRKGYRLAHATAPMERADHKQSVLVLPLVNLSPGGKEFIVDSLTELLISRLAALLSQPVISRTTAMTFKDSRQDLVSISQQLGVRWVIEGSVLQAGDEVQIVIHLIDATTDTHAWAESWTRPVGGMLAVLNEISQLVASRVRSELQAEAPTSTREKPLPTELLRNYLHGLYLNSRRTHAALHQAVTSFENVLQASPDYAPALSGLAHTYVLLAHYGAVPAAEGFGKAREYVEAALVHEPGSPDAMASLAAIEFFFDWEFELARDRVERLLENHPNNSNGLVMAANIALVYWRNERAQSYIDRALSVDPLNTGLLMNAGDHLILQHRFGEAIIALTAAVQIDPSFRPAYLRLALACAFDDRPDEAVAHLREARKIDGEDWRYLEYLSIAMGRLGREAEAKEAALRLENIARTTPGVAPWALARAWACAGDSRRAIEYLQAAYEARSSSMPFLGITPVFDRIRAMPQLQEMMDRVNLP